MEVLVFTSENTADLLFLKESGEAALGLTLMVVPVTGRDLGILSVEDGFSVPELGEFQVVSQEFQEFVDESQFSFFSGDV